MYQLSLTDYLEQPWREAAIKSKIPRLPYTFLLGATIENIKISVSARVAEHRRVMGGNV